MDRELTINELDTVSGGQVFNVHTIDVLGVTVTVGQTTYNEVAGKISLKDGSSTEWTFAPG
jgi:bacteriocin-like protein